MEDNRLSTVSTVYHTLESNARLDNGDYEHTTDGKIEHLQRYLSTMPTLDRRQAQDKDKIRTSLYENSALITTAEHCSQEETSLQQKTLDLKKSLDRYLQDLRQKNVSLVPSIVYSSKEIPCYLINSITDVFHHMDTTGTGKVSTLDFRNICKSLNISAFEQDSSITQEGRSHLPGSRNDKINKIWTEGQFPYWELCVRKNKVNLNAEDFRICLLEQWTTKHFQGLNNHKEILHTGKPPNRSPILKKVYKKFNQTSRALLKEKKRNNMNNLNPNPTIQTVSESKEPEKVKMVDIFKPNPAEQQVDIKVLNQLIGELETLLAASNSSEVSFQVLLKKEATFNLKKETDHNFDVLNIENLLPKLNKCQQSEFETKNNDPFDKQLNNIIKQLDEECSILRPIEMKNDMLGDNIRTSLKDTQKKNIGQTHQLKSEIHNFNDKDIELTNDTELPRKRTNSEVAEHKAMALNAAKDLKHAKAEISQLR